MADSQAHGDHHGSLFPIYMGIAIALAVCTASSFIVNRMVEGTILSAMVGFLLILGVAIIKAFLVGYIFMHLKWDWNLLYFIIIPAFILGLMMVIILLPDTVIGPGRDAAEAIAISNEFTKELSEKP